MQPTSKNDFANHEIKKICSKNNVYDWQKQVFMLDSAIFNTMKIFKFDKIKKND